MMESSDAAEDSPEKPVLLHGDLDIWIIEARRLPNMDLFSERLRRCFTVCRTPIRSASDPEHGHHHMKRKIITSDPYVTVSVADAVVARTRVIPNSQDPKWEEHFVLPLAHRAAAVEFHVKDDDLFGAQLIGTISVPAHSLLALADPGDEVRGWFPVIGTSGKLYKPDTALHLSYANVAPQSPSSPARSALGLGAPSCSAP